MRIIITGGTGLIGRAVSSSLASDDHEVIALSRDPTSAPTMPAGVRVVQWDAQTAQGWGHLADGAHAIVNLAGAPLNRPWTSRYKKVIRESRLNAGRAVVEAVEAAESRPKVVIQASGISLYGPRGDEVVTEDEKAADTFLGRTAVKWENSTAPVESLGVRRAIARSGVVLSAEDGAFPLMALPFRLFVGGPLGSGKQWLPWIHLEDEVRAIRFLIDTDAAAGPFHLTAPHPVTNAEFSRQLGRVMRRPAFFRVPAFAMRLVLGEMSTVVLDGQRAVPAKLQDLGFTFRFPDLEVALRDLLDGHLEAGMNWIHVLPREDLPQGARRVLNVADHEVLLINDRGDIRAVGSRCPHSNAKMEDGELTEDGFIVCPRHRSVFNLETGAVQEWVPWPPVVGRALGAISEETPLPVYPTKVEDGSIWVGLKESE